MQKKVPLRQCLGCREMKPKKELVRVVRSPENEISLDLKGKLPGRGAYVCHSTECLKKAMKTKAFDRAFECTVPSDIYEKLISDLEAENA